MEKLLKFQSTYTNRNYASKFSVLNQRYGWIGITQPRRVAAITIAKRVSDELQSRLGETVKV